ncbi:hypothetical protein YASMINEVIRUS_1353 [Yasminevirus sp. GU-2018]|uniref:Uncharacterized protein n=1 Tax=Yasminevirus sp. GU-2018 TaxID=2420051 RepID=A0A5K0UAZ6_9VIRU|nr:hypothetical protein YASMINEVIRUS_1353 [Yasminevirus sp. GU-2018]
MSKANSVSKLRIMTSDDLNRAIAALQDANSRRADTFTKFDLEQERLRRDREALEARDRALREKFEADKKADVDNIDAAENSISAESDKLIKEIAEKTLNSIASEEFVSAGAKAEAVTDILKRYGKDYVENKTDTAKLIEKSSLKGKRSWFNGKASCDWKSDTCYDYDVMSELAVRAGVDTRFIAREMGVIRSLNINDLSKQEKEDLITLNKKLAEKRAARKVVVPEQKVVVPAPATSVSAQRVKKNTWF